MKRPSNHSQSKPTQTRRPVRMVLPVLSMWHGVFGQIKWNTLAHEKKNRKCAFTENAHVRNALFHANEA